MKKKKMKKDGYGGFSLRWVNAYVVDLLVIVLCVIFGISEYLGFSRLESKSVDIYEDAMNEGFQTEIKSEVETCINILQYYYDQSEEGKMTEEEAQEQAKEVIRNMRYRDDGSGYMWIDSTDYTLVMHPILTEQEGTNRYDLEDKNGVKIIQEIMKTTENGEGGYNQFWFTKSDGTTVAEKLAYSEKFEPWGWVVTTGNYTDDMQADMKYDESIIATTLSNTMKVCAAIALFVLVCSAALAVAFGSYMASPIQELEKKLKLFAEGDLTFGIDDNLLKRKDEIGGISRQLVSTRDSLGSMINEISSLSSKLNDDNKVFSDNFYKSAESVVSVKAAIEEIAEGAMHQAEDTETVSHQIKELEDVVVRENEATSNLERAVDAMMRHANALMKDVDNLVEISEKTNEAVNFVSDQTQQTNRSALAIQSAANIITGIAEQTSLLSLNASIEAARANEYGRSFAVVAEEIRKLADDSSASVSEITEAVNELIGNSMESVNKINVLSGNVKDQTVHLNNTKLTFEKLLSEIQKVEDVAKSLGMETGKLDELKEIVADSITSLASATEQSAAGAEETSASMNALSDSIEGNNDSLNNLIDLNNNLNKQVDQFTV